MLCIVGETAGLAQQVAKRHASGSGYVREPAGQRIVERQHTIVNEPEHQRGGVRLGDAPGIERHYRRNRSSRPGISAHTRPRAPIREDDGR